MKTFSILLLSLVSSRPVHNNLGQEIQKFSSKYLYPFNPYLKRETATKLKIETPNYLKTEAMSILQKEAARVKETVKLPQKKRILFEVHKEKEAARAKEK